MFTFTAADIPSAKYSHNGLATIIAARARSRVKHVLVLIFATFQHFFPLILVQIAYRHVEERGIRSEEDHGRARLSGGRVLVLAEYHLTEPTCHSKTFVLVYRSILLPMNKRRHNDILAISREDEAAVTTWYGSPP